MAMSDEKLAMLIAATVDKVLDAKLAKAAVAAPAAKSGQVSKGGKDMTGRDASTKATFTKRGIKDVVLMDRSNPQKAYNVRPYGRPARTETVDGKTVQIAATGWISQGRQVRKGERSVKGLFHISQTDPIAATA